MRIFNRVELLEIILKEYDEESKKLFKNYIRKRRLDFLDDLLKQAFQGRLKELRKGYFYIL